MPNIQRSLLVAAGAVGMLALSIRPVAAQTNDEGRLFVRGYGGVSWASAKNQGDTEQAGMFGGGVGLNLTRNLAVIGDAGYMPNIATEEGVRALNLVNSVINLVTGGEVNLEARTLFVLGGARVTMGDGRVRLFAEGQGGVMRSTFTLKFSDANGSVVTDVTQIFKQALGKDSSTSPAAGGGGGVDIRLTRALSAEAGYHYLRLFGDAKANLHQVFGGAKVSF